MITKPIIRKANFNDADALSRIGVSTFTDTFGHLYASADLQAFLRAHHGPEYYASLLGDAACKVWVAEDQAGALVGYCSCGPCDLPAPQMPENAGELKRLYIEKSQQGSGLGRRFMDIALNHLEAEFDHLYVGVWSENSRAQQLYRSYCFEKIAEYIFMVGAHRDDEWIMKRKAPLQR